MISAWHLLYLAPLAYFGLVPLYESFGDWVDLKFRGNMPKHVFWIIIVPLIPAIVLAEAKCHWEWVPCPLRNS